MPSSSLLLSASCAIAFLASLAPRAARADEPHEGFYLSAAAVGTLGAGPGNESGAWSGGGFGLGGGELAVGHAVTRNLALALDLAVQAGAATQTVAQVLSARALVVVETRRRSLVDLRFGVGLGGVEESSASSDSLRDLSAAMPHSGVTLHPEAYGPLLLVGGGVPLSRSSDEKVSLALGLDVTGGAFFEQGGSYFPLAATLRASATYF